MLSTAERSRICQGLCPKRSRHGCCCGGVPVACIAMRHILALPRSRAMGMRQGQNNEQLCRGKAALTRASSFADLLTDTWEDESSLEVPLAELLLSEDLLQSPPAFALGGRSEESPKRMKRLVSKLQELAEGDPLEEGPLLDGATFHNLARQCRLQSRWHEQVTLLCRLGMSKADLRRLSAAHPHFFSNSAKSMRAKLRFLRSEVGLTDAQLRHLLLKFPRIVEYSCALLMARVEFFRNLGFDQSQLAKVAMRAPCVLCSLGIDSILKPRLEFIQHVSGLPEQQMGQMIARFPALLTGSKSSMNVSLEILQQAGLDRDQMMSVVRRFPNVLSCSEDSLRKHLDFLHDTGLSDSEVAVVISRCPSVLLLRVEDNLWPKFEYLTQHIGRTVKSLVTCPVYLTLSLSDRIIPRHKYWLQTMQGRQQQPFPLQPYLTLSDAKFADKLSRGSLSEYVEFKASLASP